MSQAMLRVLERVTETRAGLGVRGSGVIGVAPTMAKYWLEATKRIMNDIDCTSAQKLKGVISLL
ncbi:1-phosphatidylinositol-4,5-bisphosphate phosphodiesterase beta-2 [Gossypium australe]|uniref:1-phosphatidylinositol-4,5-bisphosphate phosphodiesterase beta-2 n=1 Tax=Gossypium australe TaxID=47621 RepID=A0A5B6WS20_9ROSI|nr:1-phosphatidylinositol-4,5-bisphosphate phosphodiesterase beta-2 [Gossypium australe]